MNKFELPFTANFSWHSTTLDSLQRGLANHRFYEVKVFHALKQKPLPPTRKNPCAAANCSHLCLQDVDPTSGQLRPACACPYLLELASDNKTCQG